MSFLIGVASQLKAQGRAARIIEDGKATAEAVELMREQWENGETQELFMIRMFPELLDKVTRVVADNLRVEKLTKLHLNKLFHLFKFFGVNATTVFCKKVCFVQEYNDVWNTYLT